MTLSLKAVITRADLKKRNHETIMRRLNRQLMVRHRFETLPKHFESVPETYRGSGGYGYRSRGAKYTKWKRNKYGHAKPNVYSGELRRSVLSKAKVTATQHGAKLTTRGTMKSRMADWQKREITVVSRKELRIYVKRQARDYKRLANSPEYRRVRRRRIGR